MNLFTGPSGLRVETIRNAIDSSIVVKWDIEDDSLSTSYTVTWTSNGTISSHSQTEQSSYTITGLTLDTVYTITVIAANRCGTGPEYMTNVSLTTDTISTTSITPTATASTNTVTTTNSSIIATIISSMESSTAISTTTTTSTNTSTDIISTSNAMMSLSAAVSNPVTTVMINSGTDTTSIIATTSNVISTFTPNPADQTMTNETSKFLSTIIIKLLNTDTLL